MKNKSFALASPLGRPLDFNYRSNVLAVVGAFLAGLAFWSYNVIAEVPLPTPGWAAAGAVFVAWAVGRELDPDRPGSAAAAMAIAAIFSIFTAPALLTGAALLLAVRMASGTVGLELRRIEMLVLVGVTALLGLDGGALVALPALLTGLFIHEGRKGAVTAGAMFIAAFGVFLAFRPGLEWSSLGVAAAIVLGLAVVALRLALPVPTPASGCDIGDTPLLARRIGMSRILAALTLALAFAAEGQIGGLAVAATVGSGLYGVGIMQRRQPQPASTRDKAYVGRGS